MYSVVKVDRNIALNRTILHSDEFLDEVYNNRRTKTFHDQKNSIQLPVPKCWLYTCTLYTYLVCYKSNDNVSSERNQNGVFEGRILCIDIGNISVIPSWIPPLCRPEVRRVFDIRVWTLRNSGCFVNFTNSVFYYVESISMEMYRMRWSFI